MESIKRQRQRQRSGARLVVIPLVAALSWVLFTCSSITGVHAAVVAPQRAPSLVAATTSRTLAPPRRYQYWPSTLTVRGGSDNSEYDDEEESEQDEDNNDDALEATSSAVDTLLDLSKRVVVMLGKATIKTAKATTRALFAVFQGDETSNKDDDEESSLVSTLVNAVQRMWAAVVNPEQTLSAETKVAPKGSTASSEDFGTFLAHSYGVQATRNELGAAPTPVLGGAIGEALRVARSKARLLVVLIPESKPAKNKKTQTPDQQAVEGILSLQVAKTAKKRATKSGDTGSFLLWSAKAGSPEAAHAMKRLKAKQFKDKRPILLVAYPAQALDSNGSPKLVPRLLAQHHCNPPPSPEQMAAWLNALRKRHSKQYGTMQMELRELQIYKDRKEGYIDSMQSDKDRKQRERKEEQERAAKEKAEEEQREAIQERRKQLRESLPAEPGKDLVGAKTVALRLADGRSSQRRFAPDVAMSALFDWVDATFEVERESVTLTTMNGQQSFSWDKDSTETLEDAGLGRMVGLRVTVQNNSEAGDESKTNKDQSASTTASA